jgi:hypothetical protein
MRTEDQVTEIIVIGDFDHVQCSVTTTTTDDLGNITKETRILRTINPGDDTSEYPEKVQRVCELVHTEELIVKWNEFLTKYPNAGEQYDRDVTPPSSNTLVIFVANTESANT